MKLVENSDVLALDKPAGVSMATSKRPGRSAAAAVARLDSLAPPGARAQ